MPAKNKIQLQQQWTQTKSDLSSKCYKREHVKYKHTHKKRNDHNIYPNNTKSINMEWKASKYKSC